MPGGVWMEVRTFARERIPFVLTGTGPYGFPGQR